jgi:7-cyano-7-deazaguanine synthase in queuosine biosynthesis
MDEVRVFCGDVDRPTLIDESTIFLDVAAAKDDPARVRLSAAEVTRKMLGKIPDRLADLLDIACYVYCADQITRRDTKLMARLGGDWQRDFSFTIAVRDLAFWSNPEVLRQLESTLTFLSDDRFAFAFKATRRVSPPQEYLDLSGAGPPPSFSPDRVVLFSGGLDSFAGATEALIGQNERVVLVSHRSSPFVAGRQATLLDGLRKRVDPARLFRLSVEVTKGGNQAVEFTQRTRSFLFATIGFIVARMFGKREVTFYENGVVSINLPLAPHVLGTRATRTTHPRVLHDFGSLFSRIAEHDIKIVNPYFWLSKADVVRKIADFGCQHLIEKTFSCAEVRKANRNNKHCGVCSQCVDRRFGILAADCGGHERSTDYVVDLIRGAREQGTDASLMEAYLLAAHRYAGISEAGFRSAYGQIFRAIRYLDVPANEAAGRLHHLHVRHGVAVVNVLKRELGSLDLAAARKNLPNTSLLSMLLERPIEPISFTDATEVAPPAPVQAAAAGYLPLPRPIRFAVSPDGSRVVFEGGPTLKGRSAALISALFGSYRDGLSAASGGSMHRFTDRRTLAQRLGIEEPSLGKRVERLRGQLTAEFRAHLNAAIGDDDVLENQPWSGYRLNPHLFLEPSLLGQPDAGPTSADVTAVSSDVTTRPASGRIPRAAPRKMSQLSKR